MHWREWEPIYEEILADFGFSRAADEDARDRLADLVNEDRCIGIEALRAALAGKDVVVLGAGASLAAWLAGRNPAETRPLIVADAAVAAVMDAGWMPALIVTDLDGNVGKQVAASDRGVPVAIHAHGDNADAIRTWVPRFPGPILPTTQAEPRAGVVNVGGFTDGDRAVFLAEAAGARRVSIAGFDREPGPYKDAGPLKPRKLEWMNRLLGQVRIEVARE